MAVLDRSSLESSPLADLHVIASELGLDSFRRLRKAELIDAILARQGGDSGTPAAAEPDESAEAPGSATAEAEATGDSDAEERRPRRRSRRRGGRGRGRAAEPDGGAQAEASGNAEPDGEAREGATVGGTVELLSGGSGFVRVSPPEPSDDDVYISAAQVRRCELVSGDVVSGPVRPPRRSERYPSLVRIDTINGTPADEVAAGTRYEDLPCTFATERLALGTEDPTVRAIEWLTPFGKGSRVTIVGATRSGKTEALRRLAAALAAQDGLEVVLVLSGTRPEETPEWQSVSLTPAAAASFAASPETQGQAVERAVEQARRVAARGGDALVLIDTLGGLSTSSARKVLSSARNIVDGGSLTIVATADEPVGGETTVIALDARLASTSRYPAIDLAASGTLRPELLVGEAGAEAIAKARAEALGG